MDDGFNWELAIDINRRALLGIVATLFSLVGFVEGGPVVQTVSRGIRRAVMIALHPAESGLRRLIYIRAKDMPLEYPHAKPEPDPEAEAARAKLKSTLGQGFSKERRKKKRSGCGKNPDHIPAFALIDRRKDFEGARRRGARGRKPKFGPQIRGFDEPTPPPEPVLQVPHDDDLLDAKHLIARLRSLHRALKNLPGEAQRMMRAMGRRAQKGLASKGPIRPFHPPGHRTRHRHAVDEVLAELQRLGRNAEHIRWLNSS